MKISLFAAMLCCSVAAAPAVFAQADRAELEDSLNFRAESMAYSIGVQAYIYGYPPVDYAQYMKQQITPHDERGGTYYAPLHQFYNLGKLSGPGEGFNGRSPNNDTVYFFSWLDLRASPIVIDVPAIPDNRYHVLTYADFYAETQQTGMRVTGNAAHTILVVGPDWRGLVPDGMHLVRMRTAQAFVLGRILAIDDKDVRTVNKLIGQYRLRPLDPAARARALELPDKEALETLEFYRVLNRFLRDNPRLPGEEALMGLFDQIGIGPNSDFDPDRISPATKRGLERAMIDGRRLVREGRRADIRGWSSLRESLGSFGHDYLYRAAIDYSGLFGNESAESVYPRIRVDKSGAPLVGTKTYRIVLPKDQPPPAHGFWSLTAYDTRTFDLIPNAINRYSVGDRTPGLRRRPDGALEIRMQKTKPTDPHVNWLPVGDGPFSVTMRLYLPGVDVFNGSYKLPDIEEIQ